MIAASVRSSGCHITVLNYGATIAEMVDSKTQRDYLIGLADPSQLHYSVGRGYLNQVVGRYANRLPAGTVNFNADRGHLNLSGQNGNDVESSVQPPELIL